MRVEERTMAPKTEYTRGLRYEQFTVGDQFVTASRTITEADIWGFACLTGDYNPLHTDAEYCKSEQFGGRIAHGLLVVSIGTGLASQLLILEGTSMGLLDARFSFSEVVRTGDTLRTVIRVIDKKETNKYLDRGIVTYACDILNQRDEKVAGMEWVVMIRKQGL